ncbi:hypothetical protein MMC14_005444 [Varicellaria rhodocarpa]|nr:hypothetical protein [Varicellaria rhodocarpa]
MAAVVVDNHHHHGASEACLTTPPVAVTAVVDYKEKGRFFEIDVGGVGGIGGEGVGMRIYRTGPVTAKKAILIVFDVFGFCPQTLQGADILSTHGKEAYQVFVPDFFLGQNAKHEWFVPPATPEKAAAREAFRGPGGVADIPTGAKKVPGVVKAIEEKIAKEGGKIESWGSVGMCWGGKIISLTSPSTPTFTTPFTASSEVHPARLDPSEASQITIPMCILASGGEKEEEVDAFEAALKGEKYVERFADQVHGWMGAR